MTTTAPLSTSDIKREVAALFTRAAPTYEQVGVRFFSHFGRRLIERMQLPPTSRGLDIASGRGALLFPAAARAVHVIGIDIAPGMVAATSEELQRRGIDNAEIRRMDAEVLAFPDATFDFAVSGYAINFFPQPAQALAEIYRVLKPGGRLGLVMHGGRDTRWDWLAGHVRTALPADFRPGPAWGFSGLTETTIEPSLLAAGFEALDVSRETREFEYIDAEDWWQGQMSNASRFFWESMTREAQAQCKGEAFAKLADLQQHGPLGQSFTALFVLAARPL